MTKRLIFVITSVFLLVMGTYISGTILTPYAHDLGATWFQIGILSGSMYAVRLFAGTPIGRLADKKGALKVLKFSLMLYPVIAVAYFLSFNIWSLIIARLLHGVASAMMLPIGMMYIGQAAPAGSEGRYTAVYNSCILLASGAGPFISTVIAGNGNYKATFAVLFVLSVMALAILLMSRNMQEKEGSDNVKDAALDKNLKLKRLITNPRLMALSTANIALSVISSLIGFFLIPFLQSKGIVFILTGSVIAIYNLISGVFQIPFGKLSDRFNKYRIVLLSGIMISIALMLFPSIKNIYYIIAAMIVISLGSAALLSSTSALSVIVGREMGMGSVMGFLSTSNSIGMIFGCVALGLMPGEKRSFNGFFTFSSVAVIVCTALFAILWKVRERRK